jgi:protein-tyrosine phosphatase
MGKRFQISENLFVGPGPTSVEDIDAIAGDGVGALLSLQADDDLGARGLRWTTLWQLFMARRIEARRVPMRDFDKRDMLQQLDSAVDELGSLLGGPRRVYLHCTAGLNRSPSVAIAFLALELGLPAAHAQVMAAHPDAVPYMDVLEKWAKRRRVPR